MNRLVHALFVWTMVLIVVVVTLYLFYTGYDYYSLPVEERFYHEHYDWFKPSGAFGHGLGIVGTLLVAIGVILYIARKQYGFLERWVRIKYMLEFHIFLCTLGPILILFHTTFKFNGIVSISFWSMVVVVLSGVVGRFIYIRIPRSESGKELEFVEVENLHKNLQLELQKSGLLQLSQSNALEFSGLQSIRKTIRTSSLEKSEQNRIWNLAKQEYFIQRRLKNLDLMKKLFEYWHVAHRPFALIMFVILVVHVIATLALGYRWIF